jgi:predicted GNAT family acetyltransferase
VLYADLSNPTTNALYQRMGYKPVADVTDYYFT